MLASSGYLWNSQGERFTKARLEGRLRLYDNWRRKVVASVRTSLSPARGGKKHMTQSHTTAPSLLGLEEDGRDLFGLAAHKLNTPLACIRGFVQTLLQRGDQLDGETVQQFHQLVLTQVDRLQGLVRDFLLLARVSGGIEALTRPFQPNEVLLSLIDDLGTEGVRVASAGDVDTEIMGDAELTRMALRPLVENGLVYGPRLGMVTVTVTAKGDSSHWEVHDAGTRLSSEAMSNLFRPFIRSDEPIERRGSGAGLGLTLTRAYAEVLGGTVGGRVDEHGTVFWLDIPTPTSERPQR